jgi:hypothetical protein
MVAAANWVAALAEVWSRVETVRASKDHLTDGDRAARLLLVDLTAPTFA